MFNEPRMLIFTIDARAEMRPRPAVPVPQGDARGVKPSEPAVPDTLEADMVDTLNEDTAQICDKIEREVRKLFPPNVTVQANLQFEQGSLLISGSVAVLTWFGSVALDAAKAEMQEQIAGLVKGAVQRVLGRTLASRGLHRSIASMDMAVVPQQFVDAQPVTGTPPKNAAEPAASPLTPTSAEPSSTTFRALVIATVVTFAIQLVLLLDRFFVIQLR